MTERAKARDEERAIERDRETARNRERHREPAREGERDTEKERERERDDEAEDLHTLPCRVRVVFYICLSSNGSGIQFPMRKVSVCLLSG